MNYLTIFIISCLVTNCVVTKVTNELDSKYLLESLRPEECLRLISGLEGKIAWKSPDNDESLRTCLSYLEKILQGLPVVEVAPILEEQLNWLNRTDISADIRKQYLQANARIVQTYVTSLETRNESNTNDSIIYNPVRALLKERIFTANLQTEDRHSTVPTKFFIPILFLTGLFAFISVIYNVWSAIVERTNELHIRP